MPETSESKEPKVAAVEPMPPPMPVNPPQLADAEATPSGPDNLRPMPPMSVTAGGQQLTGGASGRHRGRGDKRSGRGRGARIDYARAR